MRIIREIFHFTLTVVILFLLPFVVFTLLVSKTDRVAGIQSFVVLSGSMEPSIPTGSIVYTIPQTEYGFNDVVAYKQGAVTITHRIIGTGTADNQRAFKTKGDANTSADREILTPDQIVGKQFMYAPYLGYAVQFLRTWQGFAALIVFPTLLYIGFELWSVKKEIEKQTEKRIMERYNLT